jgi:transposase
MARPRIYEARDELIWRLFTVDGLSHKAIAARMQITKVASSEAVRAYRKRRGLPARAGRRWDVERRTSQGGRRESPRAIVQALLAIEPQPTADEIARATGFTVELVAGIIERLGVATELAA